MIDATTVSVSSLEIAIRPSAKLYQRRVRLLFGLSIIPALLFPNCSRQFGAHDPFNPPVLAWHCCIVEYSHLSTDPAQPSAKVMQYGYSTAFAGP